LKIIMCRSSSRINLSKWHQCLRWGMFLANFLLLVTSTFMLAYACYMLDTKWSILSNDHDVIPVIMFILFSVIILLTAIGLLGVCSLSRVFLVLYGITTVLCLLLEIALITSITMSDMSTDSFLQKRWNNLSPDDKSWLEEQFKCCGFNSSYPDTTCTISTDYCEDKFKTYLYTLQSVTLGIGIAILIFQIGGIIVSIVLIRAIKYSQHSHNNEYIDEYYFDNQL